MSSVAVRRFFAQTSRAGWRTSATTSVRRMGARRGMASDARVSGETSSNDTAWLIGSGTVTVLGAAYILSPPAKKHAHAAAKSSAAPIEDALPPPEKQEAAEPMKDDEGTEVSGADIGESVEKSVDADSPKAAKAAEENGETPASERFNDGSPGQTSAVHDEEKPEVSEKPSTSHSGTLQGEEDSGPTNLGDARQHAKDQKVPKQVADEN